MVQTLWPLVNLVKLPDVTICICKKLLPATKLDALVAFNDNNTASENNSIEDFNLLQAAEGQHSSTFGLLVQL